MNRTHAAACRLADDLGGIACTFENLADELVTSDIVISSTGSVRPIITRDMVATAMKLRKNRPIIIIDIAVPQGRGGVGRQVLQLLPLRHRRPEGHRGQALRPPRDRGEKAFSIVEEESVKFGKWLDSLSAQSTIRDLFALMDAHVAEQLRGQSIPEEEKAVLERHLKSSYKRLLHRPVSFLKEHPGVRYIEYMRRVFQLDEDYTDRHKG
ncbi:MAG: hypothetical protein MZU91_13405 [Desulfosudis oleivorans]|nr:hypothetical protein [Desulfosudis oleivorans]